MVDSWTTPGHSDGLVDLLLLVSRRWCENDDDHDEPFDSEPQLSNTYLRATTQRYLSVSPQIPHQSITDFSR